MTIRKSEKISYVIIFLIYFLLYNFKEPKFFIVRNQFYIKLYWNNNFYKIIDIDISRNFFFFYFISKIVSTIVLIHTDLDEMN